MPIVFSYQIHTPAFGMTTRMDASIPVQDISTPESRMPLVRRPHMVAGMFATLIATQALAFLMFGTGHAGTCISKIALLFENLLALTYASIAFRRARGTARLFWFLFNVTILVLLVPDTITLIGTISRTSLVSELTWRVLYCVYGTPILMMLFLPASDHEGHLRTEIYLDFFQVAIVTCLAFYTFFYLPLQQMLPADALLRSLRLSNLESIVLSIAILIRLRTGNTQSRALLLRLGLFVTVCAIVTLIGNWFDARHMVTASQWWDLGWSLPYMTAGLVAITWFPGSEHVECIEPAKFSALLGKNVVLVAILVLIYALTDRWKPNHGKVVTDIILLAALLVFTVRLAVTQFYQQKEIAHRKQAQDELTGANSQIADLLEDVRTEASSLAQVNQFTNALQACSSREELFRLIPEWLPLLLPGTSGSLSVFDFSRTHAAPVADWTCSSHFANASSECKVSRNTNVAPARTLPPETVPLIANGEALGMLTVCENTEDASDGQSSTNREFSRQTQLAYALAEHLATTIASLDLRETLRIQATRDPLTGLYNRRHMQESLEREIHRARRRQRTLSVMMLDIDHFKRYNDSFGHLAGDEALRFVAEVLLQNTRAEDLACRYGGEEFLVLLPECSVQQAAIRADELRNLLKSLYVERQDELPAMVTASVGVAAFNGPEDRPELLLKRADEALYQAKHEGRDRVVAQTDSDTTATVVS